MASLRCPDVRSEEILAERSLARVFVEICEFCMTGVCVSDCSEIPFLERSGLESSALAMAGAGGSDVDLSLLQILERRLGDRDRFVR